MKLEWVEELPAPRRAGRPRVEEYDNAIAQLKSRPGVWAEVGHTEHGTRPGSITALRRRGARTSRRKQPDGTYKHYASWPAEEDEW